MKNEKARKAISCREKTQVLMRQAICFYCGTPLYPELDGPTEFDHVLARALGGADTAGNLVAAHATCHRFKTNVDLKKISFENRREKKRTRAAEKRALEKIAKQEDLRKLIIRGSDLAVLKEDDDGPDSDSDVQERRASKEKARPKAAWPKRRFGSGRPPSAGGRCRDGSSPDRSENHGRNEGGEEA